MNISETYKKIMSDLNSSRSKMYSDKGRDRSFTKGNVSQEQESDRNISFDQNNTNTLTYNLQTTNSHVKIGYPDEAEDDYIIKKQGSDSALKNQIFGNRHFANPSQGDLSYTPNTISITTGSNTTGFANKLGNNFQSKLSDGMSSKSRTLNLVSKTSKTIVHSKPHESKIGALDKRFKLKLSSI
jgi:hypothetical protein